MGHTESTLNTEEKLILGKSRQGEVSDFYWSCRDGKVERVKELIKSIPYQDLNRLEPNGTTPLHAASFYGHVEVVRFLLHETGCRRDRSNRYGFTAYEEAPSDDIRQLFHRPGGVNRFCDKNDEELSLESRFEITVVDEVDEIVPGDFKEDAWVRGHKTSEAIERAKRAISSERALTQSRFFRNIDGLMFIDPEYVTHINKILDEDVTEKHSQYAKCKELVDKAFREFRPELLLRLYTLETPFYRKLDCYKAEHFWCAISKSLDALKLRYFQGTSYRGVKMTEKDQRAYRWAFKSKGAIQTKTFCSTSVDRSLAEFFAEANAPCEKERVLMIFTFPEVSTEAINLGKLTNELPCISEYENEVEVLLLPRTLFRVTQYQVETNYITIYLENVPVKASWFSVVKNTYGNMMDWAASNLSHPNNTNA